MVFDSRQANPMPADEDAVPAQPAAPRLHPNLAKVYRRKIEDLHGAMADPQTHDEALDILIPSLDDSDP